MSVNTYIFLKKKIYFLSFLFFLLSKTIYSQKQDSIVRFSDIQFNTDFEKEQLTKGLRNNGKHNYLSLFLATDPTFTLANVASIERQLEGIYNELDKEELGKKPAAKKIKIIYNTVHKRLLKKYELENSFSEIFKNGNYNCLSATALYSIVLEKYNIPYSIKKTATHVFLITYPESLKIIIETTNPVAGFFQYSDVFINRYVEDLRKGKLISESEYHNSSKSDLFNKYFLKDEDINLYQLIGLQYNNQAIYNYQKEKYSESLHDLQKAYLFYPNNGTKYLLKNTLLLLLSKCSYDTKDDLNKYIYTTRYSHLDQEDMNVQLLADEFLRITKIQLISKSNFDLYNESYHYISRNVEDSSLSKEIDFIYNYEIARAKINTGKTDKVDDHLKLLHALKPNHLDVQNIIGVHVTNQIAPLNNPSQLLKALEQYLKDYKFLGDNNKLARVYTACYLELAAQSFAQNDMKKGEENVQKFEEFMKDRGSGIAMEGYIEKCYSEAAAAYYKKGNYAKVKASITKGLEFVPESYSLKLRLKSIN